MGLSADRGARVELAPARVGIVGVWSLWGITSLPAWGLVRSRFALIGGVAVVGVAGRTCEYIQSLDSSGTL